MKSFLYPKTILFLTLTEKRKGKGKVKRSQEEEPHHLFILFGSPTGTERLTSTVVHQAGLDVLQIGGERYSGLHFAMEIQDNTRLGGRMASLPSVYLPLWKWPLRTLLLGWLHQSYSHWVRKDSFSTVHEILFSIEGIRHGESYSFSHDFHRRNQTRIEKLGLLPLYKALWTF